MAPRRWNTCPPGEINVEMDLSLSLEKPVPPTNSVWIKTG